MREIKCAEDVKVQEAVPYPIKPGVVIPLDYIPAQEFGQALLLAMDAERDWRLGGNEQFRWKVDAWRELAERLRGK